MLAHVSQSFATVHDGYRKCGTRHAHDVSHDVSQALRLTVVAAAR